MSRKNQSTITSKTSKKQIFAYLILLLVLVSAGGIWISKKFHKPTTQAQVSANTVSDIPEWWNRQYFGVGTCDQDKCQADADPDGDKLTNAQELFYHTDPLNPDTNKNGTSDGEDVAGGFDPSRPGQMKFEDVENDDTPLLESLVYDKDIIQQAGEMATLNNIPAPKVSDAEIKITSDNSKEAILKYLDDSSKVLAQYFPKDSGSFIKSAMEAQASDSLSHAAQAALQAVGTLKQLPVPSEAAMIQKYQIGLLELMPQIMILPSETEITDLSNASAGQWYDSVRAFSYYYQQISIETLKLKNKYDK